MSFNYGYEWKKFLKEQELLKKQYEAAGMTDAAIQALYEDALAWFNSRRKEARYAVTTISMMTQDPDTGDYRYMGMDELPAQEPLITSVNRYAWIGEIENIELSKAILALKPDYIEILTLMMEGYQQNEIATILHSSFQAIQNKIARIRKILQVFSA